MWLFAGGGHLGGGLEGLGGAPWWMAWRETLRGGCPWAAGAGPLGMRRMAEMGVLCYEEREGWKERENE